MPSPFVALSNALKVLAVVSALALPALLPGGRLGAAEAGLATADEFQARGGIPHFRAKLLAHDPVTIVFLGGSITANGSGFTGLTPRWLQSRFPESRIESFNAGISGTPSRFGAQRVGRDVLAHHPDLVFVEFAVNDGERDASEDMERLVRKILIASPTTDIVLLYTINVGAHLDLYGQGRFPKAASSHERVAEHYGLPSVGIGYAAAKEIIAGRLQPQAFAADGVHPYAKGYAVYQGVINQALEQMLRPDGTAVATRALPEPLTPGFVLDKPRSRLMPVVSPAPLPFGDGRTAQVTYGLPLPGKNWADTPVFAVDEQPLWRLRSLPWKGGKPTADSGRDNHLWQDDVRWLAEAEAFCGAAGGTGLLGMDEGGRLVFAATTRESPVLEFVAPRDGDYHFVFEAPSVVYFGPADRTVMLNVFHFAWGSGEGTTLDSQTWVKSQGGSIRSEGGCRMKAGESLAFILAKDSPSRPSLPGASLRIGWRSL